MKDDCLFCKLANGMIPTSTVYEDDMFRAIMDIEPAAKGHVLLLPKRHMANLLSIENEEAENILLAAKKIAAAMKESLQCDGINLLQNTGEAAGQTVFHLHLHLIPRYKNDGVIVPWNKLKLADGEADSYAQRISSSLH